MWTTALRTFRDRWSLFVGAVLSVALGVGLVQSAVVLLAAADAARPHAGDHSPYAAHARRTIEGVTSLMGFSIFLGLFLTVFIIGSTFGFTVVERRRELALLRLSGGSRAQVRRLLVGEGLILGLVGTAIGVLLGLAATVAQVHLLERLGLEMSLLTTSFPAWTLLIDLAAGVGSAVLGVALAARRAARVRPLDALRDSGGQQRVMTLGRWLWGLGFGVPAVAAGFVAQASGDIMVAMLLGLAVIFAGSIALQQLSPLVVPLMARALAVLGRWHVVGELAQSGMRDGVRRTATTAGPMIVLFGLVVGLFGILGTQNEATRVERLQQTRAELVVESDGDVLAGVAATEGVALASPQTSLDAGVRVPRARGGTRPLGDAVVVAVDPGAYRRTIDARLESGDPAAFARGTVVLGPGAQDRGGLAGLRSVVLRLGSERTAFPVVAREAMTLQPGADVLVDRADVPPALLAAAPTTTFVSVAPDSDPAAVGERLARLDGVRVRTVRDWAGAAARAEAREDFGVMGTLAGLGGLYAFLSLINAVAVGTAQRKRELAVARVSGASRRQVVVAVAVESAGVAAIGVLLGAGVVALCLSGVRHGTAALLGTPVLTVPWGIAAALAAIGLVAAAITSATAAWSATRTAPVRWVAARE